MSTIGCPYPSLKSLQNQASTSRVSSKVSKFWKRSRNWRWKKVKVKKRHTWQVILSSSTWWLIWFWWNLMKNSVHISSLNCTVHWPNELRLPTLQCWAKDWHTASPGNHSTSNLLRCMLNITGWQCRSSLQKHHPPRMQKSTSPRLLDASKHPSHPVLCFADEQTAEEEEHVARNHWASFDDSPKILPWPFWPSSNSVSPRAGARQSWGCHCQDCQGPKKKGTKGRLLRHKGYKGARWFGLPDPVPTRCPWRSTKWAGCWFRTWPMSLQ